MRITYGLIIHLFKDNIVLIAFSQGLNNRPLWLIQVSDGNESKIAFRLFRRPPLSGNLFEATTFLTVVVAGTPWWLPAK